MATAGPVVETRKGGSARYPVRTKWRRAIAYQVVGSGHFDLVFVPFFGNIRWAWEQPLFIRFFEQLASFSRLILLDKRGTGLSDRPRVLTLEAQMDDIRAVLDAVGSKRATLLGAVQGSQLCALFAATYPERTRTCPLQPACLPGGCASCWLSIAPTWRRVLALVLAHRGDVVEAQRLVREAVAIVQTTDSPWSQGDGLADLAEVLEISGRSDEAGVAYRQVLDLYEQKGIAPLARRTRERLAALQAPTA
jgi:pimeloyl-ACP methyl ester carboxylesterase